VKAAAEIVAKTGAGVRGWVREGVAEMVCQGSLDENLGLSVAWQGVAVEVDDAQHWKNSCCHLWLLLAHLQKVLK
jgi:hypothetical protein